MKLRALDPLLYDEEDMLHKEFVSRFYNLIITAVEPPYAISVDGLWGTGKTTVMRKLHDKLKNASYPVFWFNPWEYRQSDNVVVAFLRRLATENRGFLDEMRERSVKTILSVLAETAMDVGLSKLTDGKVSLKDVKGSFKSVEENQKFSFTDYDDIVETIKKEFIELIERISKQHDDKPVIIFFDDLDRCLPDDAIKLLEALKNLFVTKWEDPNTKESKKCNAIFICGIDTHIAKEFIQAHYKDIEENFAINYFRKIFNLTISMPQSPTIEEVLNKYLKDLEVLEPEKANVLAKMVSRLGLQIQLYSIRKYLNVITNFCIFLKFNPKYEFTPKKFDPEDDFVINLFMLQEAWQPLYEQLTQEALKERSEMGKLIQTVITQKDSQKDSKLSPSQRDFLTDYLGQNSNFAQEYLTEWLAKYPTLA